MEIDTSQLEYIRVTGHKVKKKSVNETVDEAQVEARFELVHGDLGRPVGPRPQYVVDGQARVVWIGSWF